MSKTSEINLCIGELRTAAQSLAAVADSLTVLFGGSAVPAGMLAQGGEGNDQKANGESVNIADGKVKTTQSAEPKPKPVTLAQVRAVLAEKSRCGHTAQVRELLQKHGAAKLSAIDPTEFETLLSEAVDIGRGENADG